MIDSLLRPLLSPLTQPLLRDLAGTASAVSLGPITNRTGLPTDDGGASNTAVLTETPMVLFENTTYIEFEYPNWRTNPTGSVLGGAAEVGLASPATGTAQITYLDAITGELTTVNMLDKTGGTTALSAPAGGDFVCYAFINAPRGSRIYPRFRGNFPGGMVFAQKRSDLTNGDAFQFGSSVPALSTRPVQSFDLAWYGPSSVRGYTSRDSVATISDSRDSGLTDVANDAFGNIGQWPRLLCTRLACINLSVPGDTAADFAVAAQSTRRRRLAGYAKRVAIGLGTNDLVFNNRTAAQVQADVQSIASSLGKPTMYKAIDPVSNGGATVANFPARETDRRGYNTWVRTQPIYFDPPAVLESVANPGSWADSSYQIDNTHESNIGNALAASSGATFDWSKLGSPAVLSLLPWTPAVLGSSLTAWFRPNTYTAGNWPDSSSSANHATQATPANQPAVSGSGGATFAAGKSLNTALSASRGIEATLAVITVPSLAGSSKTIIGPNAGGGRQLVVATSGFVVVNRSGVAQKAGTSTTMTGSANKILVEALVNNGGTHFMGFSGTTVGAGSDSVAFTAALTTIIGTKEAGAEQFIGDIHEIVNLSIFPDSATLARVEGFLAWGHGRQGDLPAGHPYKNAAPTV